MSRTKVRGVETWGRLLDGQREHLESVARYLSARQDKDVAWYDVVMDTLQEKWPIGIEPSVADRKRGR